jgi:hypothetical protein
MDKMKETKIKSSFRYLECIGLVAIFLIALVTGYFFTTARLIQRDSESIQSPSSEQIQGSAKLDQE